MPKFDSMTALRKNVKALLLSWGVSPYAAALHFGLRATAFYDLFRRDRGNMTLRRLDELAEHLCQEPKDLIDSSGHSPEEK